MKSLTISQIKEQFPNQWILVGNPVLDEPEINGTVLSKLISGVVLFASEDKRELAYKAINFRNLVETTACIYTGEINKNKLFLL